MNNQQSFSTKTQKNQSQSPNKKPTMQFQTSGLKRTTNQRPHLLKTTYIQYMRTCNAMSQKGSAKVSKFKETRHGLAHLGVINLRRALSDRRGEEGGLNDAY